MRIAKLVALAVGVLLTLAVLVSRSQVNKQDMGLIGEDARRMRELDARLDRAVLQAQSGLTRNYDEIGVTLREMKALQRAMAESGAKVDDPTLTAQVDGARKHLEEKEYLVESFESVNSVFRNTLAFLPTAAGHAAVDRADAAVVDGRNAMERLVLDVLRCRTDCGPLALDEVRTEIAELQRISGTPGFSNRPAVEVLLRHARLFVTYAPKLEAAVRALLRTDGRPYDDIFVTVRDRHERALQHANIYRAGLVGFSVILLGAIALMILRLRKNAVALGQALMGLEHEKRVVEQKQHELADFNQTLELRVEERTRELSASREQYRLLLETTQAIPFDMVAGSLKFSYVGPQAAILLGHPLEQWSQEGFFVDHVHTDDRGEVVGRLAASSESQQAEVEFRFRAADDRWVWLRAFVSTTEDSEGRSRSRGIFLDASTRRTLEAELRAAQKLESVGRLAAGIAHEINTPIQFVGDNLTFFTDAFRSVADVLGKYRIAFPSSALREIEAAADLDFVLEDVPKALHASKDGIKRIATIVRAMKGFGHPDQRVKCAADLNTNLENTLVIARNEYKDVADVETDLGDVPPVHCHAGEINQVLLNLVTNAAHAISDVVARSGARGRITARTWRDGDWAVVSIRDTGAGIPVEVREKLFEPFFTTKDVGRGTGQGLAIARSIIVDQHGGQLTFDSEVGRGTEFIVRLPIDGKDHLRDAA